MPKLLAPTSKEFSLTVDPRYAVNLTVGQTAVGVSASPHFQSCLGYWCKATRLSVYLPVVIKN